jgi:hypothetical protein
MSTESRSITGAFEPLLPLVSPEEVPMVVAILERIAGSKYRIWAEQADNALERDGLLACAQREDEIADFIESLQDDPQGALASLHERIPAFEERYDAVMAGLSRIEQLRVQAEGEMGGSGYMSQFAAATEGIIAARFESLALCEEANSKFLSGLVGKSGD